MSELCQHMAIKEVLMAHAVNKFFPKLCKVHYCNIKGCKHRQIKEGYEEILLLLMFISPFINNYSVLSHFGDCTSEEGKTN